jgi:hypothetical protein
LTVIASGAPPPEVEPAKLTLLRRLPDANRRPVFALGKREDARRSWRGVGDARADRALAAPAQIMNPHR